MVAIIKSSGSLRNALHYNENKVKQNVAELIHSMNFGTDTEQLVLVDKIKTLEKLTSLNERTKLNAVHISLNFDPSEKLAKDKLAAIADTYMLKIGFGNQPYLVYQHNDAGHPHIHIVSTNIKTDGTQAINKTFHMLKNDVAFSPSAIGSLQLSYRRRNASTASALNTKANKSERQYLFQHEEALNKYLKRLGELYESN